MKVGCANEPRIFDTQVRAHMLSLRVGDEDTLGHTGHKGEFCSAGA
jgi:hypothetical protein